MLVVGYRYEVEACCELGRGKARALIGYYFGVYSAAKGIRYHSGNGAIGKASLTQHNAFAFGCWVGRNAQAQVGVGSNEIGGGNDLIGKNGSTL